jgi:hypothetical protein
MHLDLGIRRLGSWTLESFVSALRAKDTGGWVNDLECRHLIAG